MSVYDETTWTLQDAVAGEQAAEILAIDLSGHLVAAKLAGLPLIRASIRHSEGRAEGEVVVGSDGLAATPPPMKTLAVVAGGPAAIERFYPTVTDAWDDADTCHRGLTDAVRRDRALAEFSIATRETVLAETWAKVSGQVDALAHGIHRLAEALLAQGSLDAAGITAALAG